MKVFSILSLLLFTSCSFEPAPEKPNVDHKIGECFLFIDKESKREEWENGESNVYVKIVKVGKNKYLVKGFQKGYRVTLIDINKFLLRKKEQITCPKELE